MVPEENGEKSEIYMEHFARYVFAAQFVKNKVVLDIACGSGYGTHWLKCSGARKVVGVDIAQETVDFCKSRYQDEGIVFMVGDVRAIPLDDHCVDAIVSFETIEHVDASAQVAFMKEIKRVLKHDGILIMSTPNAAISPEGNHFHIKELAHNELSALLKNSFSSVRLFYQDTVASTYILDDPMKQDNQKVSAKNVMVLDGVPPQENLFFIAVCADNRSLMEGIRDVRIISSSKTWEKDLKNNEIVKERDAVIARQGDVIEKNSRHIHMLDQQKLDMIKHIQTLDEQKVNMTRHIQTLDRRVLDMAKVIQSLEHRVYVMAKHNNALCQRIDFIQSSKFWKLRFMYVRFKHRIASVLSYPKKCAAYFCSKVKRKK